MLRYDMKCSFCDFETEIWKGQQDTVTCKNPDKPDCPGVMENQFKRAPYLTRAATPSRHR